jgi:hypothetical protein
MQFRRTLASLRVDGSPLLDGADIVRAVENAEDCS